MNACRTRAAAALALLASLSACAKAAPIPVPDALAASEEWPVEMRHDWPSPPRYRFGPYGVMNVRYHAIRGRGGVVDVVTGKREYQQRYEFALRNAEEAAREMRVQCDSRDRDRGFSVGSLEIELESGLSLECRLYADASTRAGILRLAGRNEDAPHGTIERGEVTYDIEGEHLDPEDEGLPATYLVRRGGDLVAMVDRTHSRIIRVAPTLPREEQDLVAAALMALLLQRKLIES